MPKDTTKAAMVKAKNPQARFIAFCNGVLDDAAAMNTLTVEERQKAIDGLRSQLDEAWADIQGKKDKN